MNMISIAKQFKQLASVTQIALIILALVVIVLLVYCPAAGSSIIAFLIALKALFSRQPS